MKLHKYRFRFFIEWGGGILWPDANDALTFRKFDVGPIQPEELHVTKKLCEELHQLEDEYQTALDWEYPPDPSPWSEAQFRDFYSRLEIAYNRLCEELNDHCDITFCMEKKPW